MNLVIHEVADTERIYTAYRQAELFHKEQETVFVLWTYTSLVRCTCIFESKRFDFLKCRGIKHHAAHYRSVRLNYKRHFVQLDVVGFPGL